MSVNIVNNDGSLSRIAGGLLYADAPVGTITPFGGSVIPSGYLLCNGAEVLKTAYAELYAVIGDAFGTASDNTKFKLPDLRGEFLRGAGTNSHSGQGNGGTVGQHQNATVIPEIEAYQGNTSTPVTNISSGTSGTSAKSILNPDSKVVVQNMWINKITGTKDSGNTDFDSYWAMRTVRPTNTSVNYIIKAQQIAIPADFLAKVDEAVEDVYGDIIPSDASASNKLITVADRASFTKTIHTTAKTQSDWHTLNNINVSDIPSGNYLVSLKSSPNVQSQNISCLLQLGGSMIAISMNGGTTQMLSCPKVINIGSATTLKVALYLGQGSTIQEGDFVIRFDRVN